MTCYWDPVPTGSRLNFLRISDGSRIVGGCGIAVSPRLKPMLLEEISCFTTVLV
jgi:hypothetical protein